MAGFAATPATADCLNNHGLDGRPVEGGHRKGQIHAPLEGDTKTALNVDPAQKDGKTMPLATEEGGDKDLGNVAADVEAQQKGDETAAAAATDDRCPD